MENSKKRPRGRPQMPETTVVNIRMPLALLDRLDRYIANEARFKWKGETTINRATFAREAVERLLTEKGF